MALIVSSGSFSPYTVESHTCLCLLADLDLISPIHRTHLCEMFASLSYSQRTCHRAGMLAGGWAALWNKLYTKSWRSGCPAGTLPCSDQDSRRSQTLPWLCTQMDSLKCTSTQQINQNKLCWRMQHIYKYTRRVSGWHTATRLTLVSVCWTTLQITCRFHPRFHVSQQTHCSVARPVEL